MAPLREPASFPGAFAYEHTDVPPGVTLADYRNVTTTPRRRRRVAIVLWLLATGRIGGRR